MANFCTNCGRPITEGVPCPCQQSDASAEQAATPQPHVKGYAASAVQPQQVAPKFYNNLQFSQFFKSYWGHPSNTVKSFMQEANTRLAILLAALFCLVNGLLVSVLMSTLFDPVDSILKRAGNRIELDVPRMLHLVDGILIGACILVLAIVVLFVLLKLMHVQSNLMSAVYAVCFSTPFPLATTFLCCVCILMDWFAAAAWLIVLGTMVWLIIVPTLCQRVFDCSFNGLQLLLTAVLMVVMLWANTTFSFQRIKHSVSVVEFNGYPVEYALDMLEENMDNALEYWKENRAEAISEILEEALSGILSEY